MARHRTDEEWGNIRNDRELYGLTFRELSTKHEIDIAAISRRAKRENWGDGTDGNAIANRLAMEKVNNIVNSIDPKKRAASISTAADRKAQVIASQQADWDIHRATYVMAEDSDKERLQCAKLAAEMLKIRHEGERKAYNISDIDAPQQEPTKGLKDFYA